MDNVELPVNFIYNISSIESQINKFEKNVLKSSQIVLEVAKESIPVGICSRH